MISDPKSIIGLMNQAAVPSHTGAAALSCRCLGLEVL